MGVIFGNIKTSDLDFQASPIEEQSCISFTLNEDMNYAQEYNDILIEGLRGQYIGVKENALHIVVESFSDMCEGLIEFFKKWIIRFKEWFIGFIKKLYMKFRSGSIYINKITGTVPEFEPFTIKGYQYTIKKSNVNPTAIDVYLNKIRHYANTIRTCKANSANAIMGEARYELSSTSSLDKYRGIVIGNGQIIPIGDFVKECGKSFRNGGKKQEVLCTQSMIIAMSDEYKAFKDVLKQCETDRVAMEDLTDRIIAHLQNISVDAGLNGLSSSPQAQHCVRTMDETISPVVAYRYISSIYSMGNNGIKNIHSMYKIYFSEKIDAVKEAMDFYAKCIIKSYYHPYKEGDF